MKKILVIEDEEAYLQLLKTNLTAKGYTVIDATNGEKGLEAAKKENPDLILLDIKMPVMDGMKMLSLLRKERSIKKIKIIMLTNLDPDDKILPGVVKGEPAYYFVKSDININDLLEKIKELLAN